MFDFQGVVNNILAYIPSIFKALILLLIAWGIAVLAKNIVEKILLKAGVDTRLSKGTEPPDLESGKNKVKSIAKIVYFFVFIMFLPSILDALDMESVSQPISNMMNSLLGFIPNLIGAGIIIFIGYFVAKILADLTKTLLTTLNIDKYYSKIMPSEGENVEVKNKNTIADVLSKVVFVIILIPIITVALQTLKMDTLTQPIVLILNKVLLMIPNIFVAVILIILGYYIAKFVAQLLESLLTSIGIENVYAWASKNTDTTIPKFNLSKIISNVVKFLIMLFFTVEALSVLKLDVLNTIGYAIIGYIPLILSGLVIIGLGIFGGYFVEGLIKKYANSPFSAMIAKYIIITFAIFMTLEQIKFASSIVNLAFLLVLGSLSVAFAVSFGLGGREFAKRQLEKFEGKIEKEDNKPPID
ncbi:MAG: mechanosensitive ion channel [Gudongella sp.]|nr:mechanosensitive ion channel [Gudongella sp.]